MEGNVFQESGWDCFCSSHSIINPRGATGRPTLFNPLLQLGLSLQLKEQSSSLGWNKVLAPGLCQVGVCSWWQGSERTWAAAASPWLPKVPVPVSIRDQTQTMAGWKPLLGPSGSGSSHTPVLQSMVVVVNLKLLMITVITCEHFTYSQCLPPEHIPVPRSSFLHLSIDMKTAPGCMDTMQALHLGSWTLIFISFFSRKWISLCICQQRWHGCVTGLASLFPRARAMLGTCSGEPWHSLGSENWEEGWERWKTA